MSWYLAVGGAVGFDGPTSLVAESFEDFIVVAVFGKLVVAVHPESREYFGGYGSPPPLSFLVVLSFLPCGQSRS